MKRYDGHGYSFWYDEEGVYPVKKDDYNFALPDCQEALKEAVSIQAKYAVKAKRDTSRLGYVYIGIGVYGDHVFKIGSSYEPDRRYSNGLQQILFIITTESRRAAFELETELHKRFSEKRYKHGLSVKKEWFELSADDLAALRTLSTQ